MPKLICFRAAAVLGLALLGSVTQAQVGLGPMNREGITNSERKGFWLSVINPSETAQKYRVYGIEWDGERPVERVRILQSNQTVPANSRRKVLVIASGLAPGEQYRFRVCAEKPESESRGLIHARVCSKLIARRRG